MDGIFKPLTNQQAPLAQQAGESAVHPSLLQLHVAAIAEFEVGVGSGAIVAGASRPPAISKSVASKAGMG